MNRYSTVMGWLRCSCRFPYCVQPFNVFVVPAPPSGLINVSAPPPMDLVRVESNLTIDSNDTRR